VGSPTVEVILNSKDPLERQFVNQAITSRLNEVQQAVSKQVLRVAVSDLQQVLNGGTIQFLGQSFHLLGLRDSRSIIKGSIASLPPSSPLRAALGQVANFAGLAIEGLGFATPVLGSIGNPLTVSATQLAGKTTPTDSYAAAIAVVVSLMFVTLLLASGMLAIERSEHTYTRLLRGLVSPSELLSEKIVLSAGCAAAVTLLMAVLVSLFVHLQWSRFELWVLALAFGGLAFGALGVAIGGLARDVSVASLMAFLVSLPIAFVALIPASAVSGALRSVLDAIAFVFPFKAALQATDNAFSGAAPGIGWPLLHLAALTVVFAALARVALRRYA
jgi:ABC-type transport system involved in multi-copper enzyme maturation permease subunit